MPVIHNAFDGRSAVTMFFILSGFVLSIRYFQDPTKRVLLASFYLRRVTRIWFPWLVFFTISLIAASFRPHPPLTEPALTAHHLHFWSHANTLKDIFLQLLFCLHDSSRMMLPQDWSLGVEMRASLLIPLMIFCIRFRWFTGILIAASLYFLKPSGGYYYASFAIGAITAMAHIKLASRTPCAAVSLGMLILGVLSYQIRWASEQVTGLSEYLSEREVWIISSVGCALFIRKRSIGGH